MGVAQATLYTKSKSDELYTPKKMVDIIKTYLPKGKAWLPFDTEDSEFTYMCRELGIEYECSHIWEGKDFFEYTPEHFDYILSNPPFSIKKKVIERCIDLNKPFALVHNIMMWNYHEIGDLGLEAQKTNKPLQVLFTNKRISYDGNPSSFGSGYVCRDFLPNDFMFAELSDNNVGKYFEKSRMNKE